MLYHMHTIPLPYHQLGICKLTVKHNNIDCHVVFFVVPVNGTELLGMQGCKRLELLSVNCIRMNANWKERPDQWTI